MKIVQKYFIFTLYTLVYTMFIVILQFIEGVVQTDKDMSNDHTNGKLHYSYHLTCTRLHNDY